MAARRSNKRKRRNRGRFGGLYQLLSFVIILAVVLAGCIVFFRVNEITVVGQGKYTAQQIIDASGIQNGDNLFLINKARVARQIYTGLPYVDEVNPRRVLPDQVILTVTECTPAAVVQGGEGWWIIDAKGKLLEQVTTGQQPGLAGVTGVQALLPTAGTTLSVAAEDAARLDSLKRLMRALTDRGMMERVTAIDLTGPGDLLLSYDGRFTVKVPLSADYPQKMRILEGVVAKLQPNEKGSIDLTREDKVYFDPE